MPELKRRFTAGKMNQDLDERLIPSGQYKDALNIEVATSEDSNVGTAQTLLGNTIKSPATALNIYSTCVGAIGDGAKDKVYYFVSGGGTN